MLFQALLLTYIFIYPSESVHSRGTDSFQNIALSQNINERGYFDTFITTFSFFGLYPNSRNLGGGFLLSAFSITTGLPVELSLLFLCFGLMTCMSLGMFSLSREISNNNIIALISLLLLTTSRRSYYYLIWSYSYRAAFIALLLPLLFLIFYTIKHRKQRDPRFVFPILFYSIVLVSIHKMSYFLIFLIPLIILSSTFYYLYGNKIRFKLITNNRKIVSSFIIISILLISFFWSESSSFYRIRYSDYILPEQISEIFFLENYHISILVSFFYELSRNTSALFVFSIIGLFKLIYDFADRISNFVLLCICILLCFFWFDSSYSLLFFLPFLIYINSLGFHLFFKSFNFGSKTTIRVPLAVTLLLFSQFALPPLVDIPTGDEPSDETTAELLAKKQINIANGHDLGIYLRYNSQLTIMGAFTTSGNKVFAFCGCPSTQLNVHSNPSYEYVLINPMGSILDASANTLFDLGYEPSKDYKYSVLLNNQTWKDSYSAQLIEWEFDGNGQYNYISKSGLEDYMSHDGVLKQVQFSIQISDEYYKIFQNEDYSNIYFSYEID